MMDKTYTQRYRHGETDAELMRENDNDGMVDNEVRVDNAIHEIMELVRRSIYEYVGEASNAHGTYLCWFF